MGTNYSPRIVTDGLQYYMDAKNTKCYPGTGTAFSDLTGKNADGALEGTVNYNAEGYFETDGLGNLACGTIAGLGSSLTGLTLNAWVYLNTITGTFCIAENGTAFNTNTFYMFYLDSGSPFGTFKRFELLVYGGGSHHVVRSSAITDIGWYYVTLTWSSGNPIQCYINGKVDNGAYGSSSRTVLSDGNTGLYIGCRPATSFRLDGNVSSFSFYDRELTAEEVLQNFNATRGRYGI